MVNPILGLQLERIEQFKADGNAKWHLLTLTTWLVSFFYPFWATLSALAGVALLVIPKALYNGKKWARGLALVLLAIPSMGGAYMIVPWMNFVGSKEGGFPPAITIMMIGLIPSTTPDFCGRYRNHIFRLDRFMGRFWLAGCSYIQAWDTQQSWILFDTDRRRNYCAGRWCNSLCSTCNSGLSVECTNGRLFSDIYVDPIFQRPITQ
jgi:hypothetical protein